MAETRAKTTDAVTSRGDPVLRPGRPADPARPSTSVRPSAEVDDVAQVDTSGPELPGAAEDSKQRSAGNRKEQAPPPSTDDAPDTDVQDDAEGERLYAESHQRRLRRLLRQCERVNLMDFNVLSLAGWPDNYTLNAARRRRDSWLLSATIAALIFLSGMTGFVPAWIAGGGFGALVVILLMGVPVVRRLYSSKRSYLDLVLYRQQLLRDARKHIARLEGELGLIWQCNELSEFNPTLSAPRFSTLKHLSEQRRLPAALPRREHVRLYLIFMLEAEKAYERMQNAYFEGHQKAIDRGWKTVADTVTEKAQETGVGASVAGEQGRSGKAEGQDQSNAVAGHSDKPAGA